MCVYFIRLLSTSLTLLRFHYVHIVLGFWLLQIRVTHTHTHTNSCRNKRRDSIVFPFDEISHYAGLSPSSIRCSNWFKIYADNMWRKKGKCEIEIEPFLNCMCVCVYIIQNAQRHVPIRIVLYDLQWCYCCHHLDKYFIRDLTRSLSLSPSIPLCVSIPGAFILTTYDIL